MIEFITKSIEKFIEGNISDKSKLTKLDKPLAYSENIDCDDKIEGSMKVVSYKDNLSNLDVPLNQFSEAESNEYQNQRELTQQERQDIQDKTGWTDKQMDKCTMNEDDTVHYKTDNESLEGQIHERSGVKYEKRIVDIEDIQVEVVVPKFDSKIDVQLPENLEKESNPIQFSECNKQLKEKIENIPEFKNQFTDGQLEDIMEGSTPEGYTWHHDAKPGKMQLVETMKHDRTQGGAAHTGGKALWGGSY